MKKILLINGDMIGGTETKYLLEEVGHTVTWAINHDAGIEKYSEGTYDLILCDIELPRKKTGFDFYEKVKNDFNGVFIVHSGSDKYADKAEELGINFLHKFDSVEQVIELLSPKI